MNAERRSGGATFWAGAVSGIGIMLFGLRGLLENARATEPPASLAWLVGADLVHDLLIAPAACLVGVLLTRALPRPWRAPIRGALFATAIVLAVGWAPLRGYGRATVPDNPTVQPLHYGTAVATVLVVVWLIALAWLLGIAWRRAHVRPG